MEEKKVCVMDDDDSLDLLIVEFDVTTPRFVDELLKIARPSWYLYQDKSPRSYNYPRIETKNCQFHVFFRALLNVE